MQFEEGFSPQDLTEGEVINNGGKILRKCQRKSDGTFVFVKSIPFAVPPENRFPFIQEITKVYRSESPYTLHLFGAWLEGEYVHLAGEYASHGSLADIVGRRGPLPEPVVQAIAKQAVGALFYLHNIREPQLIHRAIKPSNMLITESGLLKLTDFGMGKEIKHFGVNAATFALADRGLFMSPERIEANGYGLNADTWSLGLSLMEIILGTYPYDQDMPDAQLLSTIVTEPPPQISASAPVSDACRDFIHSCLIKDPEDRPDTKLLIEHPFIASISEERAQQVVQQYFSS